MNLNFNYDSGCTCISIAIVFIFGLIFYINSKHLYESFGNFNNSDSSKSSDPKNQRCPNMLIEKDGKIYLYNSELATVPGVNPVQFDNLEEYAEFVEWQESQNINCKVLFLQYTTDTQNNELIQVKPSIFENNGGLPKQKTKNIPGLEDEEYYEKNKMLNASLDSTPDKKANFNKNMYSGFDQYNQNVGLDTPLDKMYTEKNKKSANPMDTHWGGKKYTESKIKAGDYKDREVYKHNI